MKCRVVPSRHAGSKYLNGLNTKSITDLNFRIGIVSDYQNFSGSQIVIV